MKLNLACWNSRGIMSGVPYLLEYLHINEIDVIGISEHWLRCCQIDFLDTIDPMKYTAYAKGVDEHCHQVLNFNNRGGVAILVSKTIAPFVEILDIQSNRIIWIQINVPNMMNTYVISVYLPV